MADYIDRSVAIARITAQEVAEPSATMAAVRRVLADMPAAAVAPVRHGRWVLVNKAYDKYKCSNCGALDYITIGQKYCIYCGAKMDGGTDDEM